MSKFIKLSQQEQLQKQPQEQQKGLSNIDAANLQKLKSMKGNLTLSMVMAELLKISRGPGTEAQKEAEAKQYLQATLNKLTPMAQFLNTMGVKIPRN